MKSKILLIFLTFFLISCEKKVEKQGKYEVEISERIKYSDDNQEFKFTSGKFEYRIPKSDLPFEKILILNASLVGYVSELGAEGKISGVSSPEYIFSSKILNRLVEGKIQNVGNEQKYDIEKIIELQPDAVFTNYVQTFENTYDLIRSAGIPVIFIDEYLEQDPLKKASIIRLFGHLLGLEKEAEDKFNLIKNKYTQLKDSVSLNEKPIVLSNEMYGNQWFMAGGNTYVARYIQDAGGAYILKDNSDISAVPMTFEEVYVKAEKATIWVNAGNHSSKASLLNSNPNYGRLSVIKNGRIYGVNGRIKDKANDFFEQGVVRADLVLKDYITIFSDNKDGKKKLTFLKELH